jgi:3-hydroxyisobutyrate dehydrogenase-like beta-hydroxyacid dehydrogenase
MASVAFLGLGVMGAPMARHLAGAGHAVTVYNRTAAKAQAWVEAHGGRAAPTPREAAADQDVVLCCVGDDPDLKAVAEPAIAAMRTGAIFIDHTTASPGLARELFALGAARGVGVLDAPVSGGQAGAENAALTVMAGGDGETFAAAEPIMRAYAKTIVHVGEAGAGQLVKAMNQIAIAGVVEGLSEALAFGMAAGVDPEKAIAAISQGAAGSWQMNNRWKTMTQGAFEFGFAVEWMRKDLRIALSEARAVGASLPVAALVDQFYAEVEAMGGKRWDTSSLIARLRRQG